jgi:hypothetical protein
MFGKTGELRHIGRSWDCLAPTPREISALRDDSLCCFFSALCTLRTSFFRGPPPNDPVTTRSDFGRTHGSASTDIFFGSSLFRVGNQKIKQQRVDSFLSQSEGRASLAVANVHRACEAKAVKAAKRSEAPEGLGLDWLGFACQPVL